MNSSFFFDIPRKPKVLVIKCNGFRFKKVFERYLLLKSKLAVSIRVPKRFFQLKWKSIDSCLNSIRNLLTMRETAPRRKVKNPTKKQLLKQSKEMDEQQQLKEWFDFGPDNEDKMWKVIL